MKSLMLVCVVLCSSAGATQESLMRFTAPVGTVSNYRSEYLTETRMSVVSLKSLDGKGIPQGLRAFVLNESPNKTIQNSEHSETVLEQDEKLGARIQHTGWNRSSAGLIAGPRIQLEYTLSISSLGKVQAQNIQAKIIEPSRVPTGAPGYEKVVLEGQKASVFYGATLMQAYFQPFELGRRQPVLATPESLGEQASPDLPSQVKLGEVQLLERTSNGGFRFALDVDTARYTPELLNKTPSSYRIKQYSRQSLEYGIDGRLMRSSGTSSNVVRTPSETREFQGRSFEVVTAIITTTTGSTVRTDLDTLQQ